MLQRNDLRRRRRTSRPPHLLGRRLFFHYHSDQQLLPDYRAGSDIPHLMIEARDLKKSFGSHLILDGVSFRIEKGESVAIIGRSGGGKSVLLKHLIGLLQPDSGEVL